MTLEPASRCEMRQAKLALGFSRGHWIVFCQEARLHSNLPSEWGVCSGPRWVGGPGSPPCRLVTNSAQAGTLPKGPGHGVVLWGSLAIGAKQMSVAAQGTECVVSLPRSLLQDPVVGRAG